MRVQIEFDANGNITRHVDGRRARPNGEPRKGSRTPWGPVQTVRRVAAGFWFVSTAGHGGIKLDRYRNAAIPAYMRRPGGWYEEDCEWSIPFVALAAVLDLGDGWKESAAAAVSTFRNWFPDDYERFYGVKLKPGESSERDRAEWRRAHARDLQAVSAWGDWEQTVPAGLVGVAACVGGRNDRGQYASEREYFLVPEADYDARGGRPFLVDRATARPWEDPNRRASK